MDAASIAKGLKTAWAGQKIVAYGETDSTNRQAKQLAKDGAPHGTLVIADAQTAGRGRRGRGWISPSGEGIFMSLILRPDMPPAKAARLSLTTALATARAIRRETGLDARIKWPNDIVVTDGRTGRKVCGMLLEMELAGGKLDCVVAGVGINVHQTVFDAEIAGTASSLDLLAGRRFAREDIVRAFLGEFEAALELDDAAMLEAYRALSATIGARVQVIALAGTYTGVARGVTESGSLLVEADDDGQVREVLAADVSVRGIMGYA